MTLNEMCVLFMQVLGPEDDEPRYKMARALGCSASELKEVENTLKLRGLIDASGAGYGAFKLWHMVKQETLDIWVEGALEEAYG